MTEIKPALEFTSENLDAIRFAARVIRAVSVASVSADPEDTATADLFNAFLVSFAESLESLADLLEPSVTEDRP